MRPGGDGLPVDVPDGVRQALQREKRSAVLTVALEVAGRIGD